MVGPSRCWIAIAAATLLAACGSSSMAGGDGSVTGDGPAAGSDAAGAKGVNPIVAEMPASTGNATVDRMIKTAATCGYQSPNTTPAGWQMVPVGEKGCATWAPPGWVADGAGTPVVAVKEQQAGETGYLNMSGVPAAGVQVSCTLDGIRAFLGQTFEAWGCTGVEDLLFEQGVEEVAGVQVPSADYFFACSTSGLRKVGYAWISLHGTTPLCNMMIIGVWMPEAQIEQKVCTLTQVFQSGRCPLPGGGFCSDGSCDADCKRQGQQGGACDGNDNCICR